MQKMVGLTAAGGQVQLLQGGALLESAELQAGIQEILCRSGPPSPGSLVSLLPQSWEPLLLAHQSDPAGPDFQFQLKEVLVQLAWAINGHEQADNACLILLPVHCKAPLHWTLLSLFRQQGSNIFQVQYWDPLHLPAAGSKLAAQASLKVLVQILGSARVSATVLPEPAGSRKQVDGWSCGLWVLLFSEQLIRQLRGEGVRIVETSLPELRANLNKYLQALMKYKQLQDSRAAPAPGPPPLPPPAEEPEEADATAIPLSLGQPAHLPSKVLGCSKCRYSVSGCLQCNAAKATVAIAKKAV